jgi:hypothetical protein
MPPALYLKQATTVSFCIISNHPTIKFNAVCNPKVSLNELQANELHNEEIYFVCYYSEVLSTVTVKSVS